MFNFLYTLVGIGWLIAATIPCDDHYQKLIVGALFLIIGAIEELIEKIKDK